jgi:hypothetical protein
VLSVHLWVRGNYYLLCIVLIVVAYYFLYDFFHCFLPLSCVNFTPTKTKQQQKTNALTEAEIFPSNDCLCRIVHSNLFFQERIGMLKCYFARIEGKDDKRNYILLTMGHRGRFSQLAVESFQLRPKF